MSTTSLAIGVARSYVALMGIVGQEIGGHNGTVLAKEEAEVMAHLINFIIRSSRNLAS